MALLQGGFVEFGSVRDMLLEGEANLGCPLKKAVGVASETR